MMHTKNILEVFERATLTELIEGSTWYNEAHDLALELSPHDVWRGAGVISAFSPLRQWKVNVQHARDAFSSGIATGHTGANNAIAQRILDGEHTMDVLRGPKTRAFAAAIATNGNSTIATIDRHAYDIALGRVHTDSTRRIGKAVYRELALAYSDAADRAGVSINAMQAITWLTWRREKGIK